MPYSVTVSRSAVGADMDASPRTMNFVFRTWTCSPEVSPHLTTVSSSFLARLTSPRVTRVTSSAYERHGGGVEMMEDEEGEDGTVTWGRRR